MKKLYASAFVMGTAVGAQLTGVIDVTHTESALVEFMRDGTAWWIFSAAMQALPEPKPAASMLYVWLYRFGNLLGANLRHAGVTK